MERPLFILINSVCSITFFFAKVSGWVLVEVVLRYLNLVLLSIVLKCYMDVGAPAY